MTDRLLISHVCVQVEVGACIMCAYISCVYITSDSILIKQHMLPHSLHLLASTSSMLIHIFSLIKRSEKLTQTLSYKNSLGKEFVVSIQH